jgi:hypothetical protein
MTWPGKIDTGSPQHAPPPPGRLIRHTGGRRLVAGRRVRRMNRSGAYAEAPPAPALRRLDENGLRGFPGSPSGRR